MLFLDSTGGASALDPSTIIWALAGALTTLFGTLGGLLLKLWQARVQRAEEAERAATAALLAALEAERERLGVERDEWRDRAAYLENQRAYLTKQMMATIDKLRGKSPSDPPSEVPRSESPYPGGKPETSYSQQTMRRRPPRS